jgi:uncharacterized protein YhaN
VRISQISIDGFGAWSGLQLDELSPELNVIYGPNEAGKTTLMEFLRSVLYGFSPERRLRYIPPVRGGPAGGAIGLVTSQGEYRLSRELDPPYASSDPGRTLLVAASFRGANGNHGDAPISVDRLPEILGGVDEATYNNVFAVGLREMQELGTLDDTAAARLLYDLTTGLDRVSLGQVMHELSARRRHLLAESGHSQLQKLAAEWERLRGEIADLGSLTPRYANLLAEREQTQLEIAQLENEIREIEAQVRILEVASTLRDKWDQRGSLDRQLAAIDQTKLLPPGTIERLAALNRQLQGRKRRVKGLRAQRRKLREAIHTLPMNHALGRHSTRLQSLLDQQEWAAGLERQAVELKTEAAELELQIEALRERLGIDKQLSQELVKSLSTRSLAPLRPLARALRDSQRRLEQIRQQATVGLESSNELNDRVKAILTEHKDRDVMSAVERTGKLVSQLRRRIQLDQRLEQMAAHQADLESQCTQLLDRQLLPVWAVGVLGAVFVLGVALVLAGWLLSFGWALAVLGVGGVVTSVAIKFVLEHSAQQQLEGSEKQLGMLKAQLKACKQERRQLDEILPEGGGPLGARLEKAETELALLEEVLPIEAQRRAVQQDSALAQQRLSEADAAVQESERRWQQALKSAGWPTRYTPSQVWQLAGRCQQVRDLHRRLEKTRQDLQQVERSLESFGERVLQMLADVDLAPEGTSPSGHLRQLRQELASQESHVRERADLVSQSRQLSRREKRQMLIAKKVARRRKMLLRRYQALDEEELRRRAEQQAKLHELRAAREKIDREIAVALAGDVGPPSGGEPASRHKPALQPPRYSEDEVRRALDALPNEPGAIDNRWSELSARLHEREQTLRDRIERRGQLAQQMQTLADDRRLSLKRLELGCIEERIEAASHEWQTLAVTSLVLEGVRQAYERDRQPATLQEASQYLDRMTSGRYTRVWTPLDDNVLLVDDEQGNPLRVEVLSRGTREQLFLSLRMALVTSYARRGVELPLVLDDVFVNFDSMRSKLAAALLRDFAASGHQLLVFTCHEHIARMFKSLRVPVRQLPVRGERIVQPAPSRPRRAAPLVEPVMIEPVKVERPASPVIEVLPEPVAVAIPQRLPVAVELPEPPPAPLLVAEEAPAEVVITPLEFPAEEFVVWSGPEVPVVSASSIFADAEAWEVELPPPPVPPRPVAATYMESVALPPPPAIEAVAPLPAVIPMPVPAAPVQIELPSPQLVEPVRVELPRVEPVRVDPPRRRLERHTSFRRRWDAEEFAGELADRVFDPERSASS